MQGNITKATGKMTALVRGALTTDDSALLIPSVEEYHAPSQAAPTRAAEAARKRGRGPLTDNEIEDAIGPLLDYFNDTFRVLNETLSADGASYSFHTGRPESDALLVQLGSSSAHACGRKSWRRLRRSCFRRSATSRQR